MVTYHESDAVSPITGSRGIRESIERVDDSGIVSLPKADLRDSIESSSKKGRGTKGSSIRSKQSSNQHSITEESQVKQTYFKVQKRSGDAFSAEQISEMSVGSSYTNQGYPLMPGSDMPLSGKTQES